MHGNKKCDYQKQNAENNVKIDEKIIKMLHDEGFIFRANLFLF
jgi:hypothetical protein